MNLQKEVMPSRGGVSQADFAAAVKDHILDKWSRRGISCLKTRERVVLYTVGLEFEVCCGGFSQFFYNTAGNFMQQTIDGLEEIGAPQTAALLREVGGLFKKGIVPRGRVQRWQEMQRWDEAQFNRLDELETSLHGFDANWCEDLDALLASYINAHHEDFRLSKRALSSLAEV